MAKLTGLGIENFRIFKDYTAFEFAPITLLTGANNSGKSSLIKSMLLLADNINKYNFGDLRFDDDKHHLGSFEKSKTNNNEKDFIKFQLVVENFELSNGGLFQIEKLYIVLIYTYKNKEEGVLEAFVVSDMPVDDAWIDKALIKEAVWEGGEQAYNYFTLYPNVILAGYNLNREQNSIKTIFNVEWYKQFTIKYLLPKLQEIKESRKNRNFNLSQKEQEDLIRVEDSKLQHIKTEKFYDIKHFIDKIPVLVSKNETKKWENWANLLVKKIMYPVYDFRNQTFFIPNVAANNPKDRINQSTLVGERSMKTIIDRQLFYLLDSFEQYQFKDNFSNSLSSVELQNLMNIAKTEALFSVSYCHLIDNVISPFLNNFYSLFSSSEQILFDVLHINNHRVIEKRLYSTKENTKQAKSENEENKGNNYPKHLLDLLIQDFDNRKLPSNHKSIRFINKWFGKDGFGFDYLLDIQGQQVKLFQNGYNFDLVDLGFGVSQILTILLAIALTGRKVILLEEPESNLHPKLQSLLADMLIDAHKTFDINFIVETHSEYLIRKLQYLTADKKITGKDTAIYYFYADGKIETIGIQEDGELEKEFGKGFFDEAARWIGNLWKLTNL
jgi:AAA15 family ATPase/GTPase